MTARRGCHETPAPSRSLAVRGARPLGPIDLAADQRAGLEDALVPECRLLVRFLGAQPVRRLGRAWIVLIDVILCAHVIATPIVFSESLNLYQILIGKLGQQRMQVRFQSWFIDVVFIQ